MKLTKEQAIDYSIELWEWLAETGARRKSEWEGWERFGVVDSECFLCEYNGKKCDESGSRICAKCPYCKAYNHCINRDTPFVKWLYSGSEGSKRKYAKLFLEQLKELKK